MAYTVVDNSAEYFNTKLYTGDGTGAKAITGVGFQPDLVWLKTRSTAFHHQLHDRVRGATAGAIYSSLTNAQDSNYPITSFDSDGFTLGNSASLIADSFGSQNASGTTMCSWNWLANGAVVSNTAGSITSTVSANTTAGFSIVSYTGTGANATIGHGLGVAPSMFIIKRRDSTGGWITWHNKLTNYSYYLQLNNTDGQDNTTANLQNVAPTSSVFSIGTGAFTNASSATYIAYCFAEVKGYSKFGSYTGNGSTDGTFIYTGFKPAFVMWKSSDNIGENWCMLDNKRDTFNLSVRRISAESSNAEAVGGASNTAIFDMLSNGFKHRGSGSVSNGSGNNYIYMAFAENPFVSSTGIPTTAR